MDKISANELIEKYLNGTCTAQEKQMLENFYQQESAKRGLPADEINFGKIKTEIWNSTRENIKPKRRPIFTLPRIAAAASILLVTVALIWYSGKTTIDNSRKKEIAATNIEPARQKAILTLADGSTITLEDQPNGTLTKQGGNQIVKLDNGSVAYKEEMAAADKKIVYNTMSTPRGGYYHLTLSDGSDVWLNSASSITYPASFVGAERSVSIIGEAYFEIAKDTSRPFIVKSGDQTVKVLGTHFNVMAYQDDKLITTTLLEGSVRITKNDNSVILKPGQSASNLARTAMMTIKDVNVENAVAWKNGYFKFDNETLGDIMKKISRWYDIDVEFKDDVRKITFWGTYSRSKNIADLLSTLELTQTVHFKLYGRRVIVMK
ncbi:FecR family protein [Pedobacter sp. ok626]|uniref:FecR family protein n=1 Tax=Pedobacter sp. ok626 TaxID=1761882 RepID=UPI000887B776|nr:FecR domain-containing protein [Pedobacter sp. ok626]SDK18486.1 FecR family protein [Pedobacter sp. ok626]